MRTVLLQPAYVLHRRSYRETSFLIELLTPDYGRLSVVIKGARKEKSALPGLLQPFVPLTVSWTGRGELMALTHVELAGTALRFQGECLFAGLYLNELLVALLERWVAHSGIYKAYQAVLQALDAERLDEGSLRSFEKRLLEELGYGILPRADQSLHNTLLPDQYYRFVPEQGFIAAETDAGGTIFLGKHLLAIANEDWSHAEILKDAKRLTRLILGPLLGSKQIHSRKLFAK
jgi:DNA repair protein RecO (recombination protein O)